MYILNRLVTLLMFLFILQGCGDQRILEELGFTHTTSYDLVDDNDLSPEKKDLEKSKLLITNSIPRPDSEGGSSRREVLSTTASTSKDAKIKIDRQTELMVVSGKLRNVLFGMSLAKEGIWEHIDTLIRDPSISPRVKITIVNGKAHELIIKDYTQHPRTGQYIHRMLEKEAAAQTIPQVTLYHFTKDFLDDGIDPVAPIISHLGDHIGLDGIALFRGDRYITKIEPDQALIFAFMRGKFKNGSMSVDLSTVGRENEYLMFSSMNSKRSIKITSNNTDSNIYHANITINVLGTILEYTGDLSLANEEDQRTLEQLIAQYIVIKGEEMFAMMQDNQVDSIGIGKYIRNTLAYEQWKALDWNTVYSNLEITFNVNIRIKDYGKFVNTDQ